MAPCLQWAAGEKNVPSPSQARAATIGSSRSRSTRRATSSPRATRTTAASEHMCCFHTPVQWVMTRLYWAAGENMCRLFPLQARSSAPTAVTATSRARSGGTAALSSFPPPPPPAQCKHGATQSAARCKTVVCVTAPGTRATRRRATRAPSEARSHRDTLGAFDRYSSLFRGDLLTTRWHCGATASSPQART